MAASQTQVAPSDATNTSMKHHTADHSTIIHCPDPSAHHTKNTTLQDHASAAALHSTRPSAVSSASAKDKTGKQKDLLGPDGKLSSASAATSLKHARAQDLPGFPVVGIDTQTSAGTAANLANANRKSPEWWKPEQSAAAGKAALLAKDYKMAPLWQPEASSAGSKAALLAHKGGPGLNLWQPEASADGHSAATLAMKRQSTGPTVDRSAAEAQTERNNKALRAAHGAVSMSGRQRAQSTPVIPPLYPDSANSAKNALSAAKLAHTPSMKATKSPTRPLNPDSNRLESGAMEAARIQHAKSISRDMYTEHPPIALEEDEKQKSAALRASAISMAKQMYDVQQKRANSMTNNPSHAHNGALAAQNQRSQNPEADLKEQAMRYIGIQEAAQKLAAERLSKIGPDENAAFRSYYGYEKPTRSKLTMRRSRTHASTDPEESDSDEDDFRSRRIRSQMSQLNKSLAEVDAKKQSDARRHVLEAAERKVQAQMQGLDKKIYDETGKMSPAMLEDWDNRARARAVAASEARMENHGKVHIGHGKFVDQSEIDAVAQARIQPTLDEIAEKTEKRRAEEEERRLDAELKKREQQKEKTRAAELKAEEKRAKEEEKKALKTKQAEEKAAAKEEKRMSKEKRKSGEATAAAAATAAPATKSPEPAKATPLNQHPVTDADLTITSALAGETTTRAPATEEASNTLDANEPVSRFSRSTDDRNASDHEHEPTTTGRSEPESPTTPTSPTSPRSSKGFKSFLSKFKRRSRHSAASADSDKPGFIGGVNLRESTSPTRPRTPNHDSAPMTPQNTRTTIGRYSSVSSLEDADDDPRSKTRGRGATRSGASSSYEEARDDFDEGLAPPPSFPSDEAAARKGSPNRDSKFHEVGL
ncbi:hypothetical protein BU24DRAFT_424633 [Aaosphaeria arxii CBS 175.79]|uniref:Eisosome protein 1 n=1 Tax=Aaosphaeria arxii CBS 175.79 TaxID=1450172 RepID=A0A6A5XL12_9PLEO|nr:uncharacterized protein BU24DRAFT_424633 [Aaosphaeria arxii CBS 175.79]KAF2013633.1 hypothetical protein BU24DRAFT_424633 [Aaosphaeria arxii CBS 175.79]